MNVGTAANAAENLTVTGAGKLDELRVYSRYQKDFGSIEI